MRTFGQERLLLGEHFGFPGVAGGPLDGNLDRGSRHGRYIEQVERHTDNLPLQGGIERLAARTAEREVGEDEAWHATMLNDIARSTDDYRGVSVFL